MGKVKGDIFIGMRMREEIDRIFPTLTAAAKAFRCDRKIFTCWANGATPNGMSFAKLHAYGGDVMYVITGKGGAKDGK